MAETRAVSRALRKAYAIGIPAIEELKESQPEQKAPASKKKLSPEDVITENQRRRIFAIAKEHNVDESTIKEIIKQYGYESTKDIKIKHYDQIITDIQNYNQPQELEETNDVDL